MSRPVWLSTVGGLVLIASLQFPDAARAQLGGTPAPEWRWRQILSVPRIGSRLRAITVDQRDPDRIYVGTEEGTLLKTRDGGVTWVEVEMRPFVLYDRSLGLRSPGLPALGATTPNNFKTFVDPPWQTFTDRIPIPSVADPFPIKPDFFFAGFLATSPSPAPSFLWDVSRSRFRWVIPVRRIALCPGGMYEVIVATKRDVFGSQDDGDTFVRLFANPGPVDIDNVTCNPSNPEEIAVATGIGLFVSHDGGLTFDQDLDAWPGQGATAVAYGPGPDGKSRLYSAAGSEMFAGRPGTEKGMEYIYPSGDSSTAPWTTIRWISTNDQGDVWLATNDGARFSPDYGKTWATAARTLLSRQSNIHVQLGENERGGKRIALMLNVYPGELLFDSTVYASDDNGNSWHPFFHGLTRRHHYQMDSVNSSADHPAGWWLVTTGGVWTTYPAAEIRAANRDGQTWARRRIGQTPTLDGLLDTALDNTELSNEAIHGLANAHRRLNWVPRLDMLFEYRHNGLLLFDNRFDAGARQNQRIVVRTAANDDPFRRDHVVFFVQASWDIKDVLRIAEDFPPYKDTLHELRRQVSFAAEDAWHERMNLLGQLENGLDDPFQIETLKTRVLALEAMLDVWLGRPIAEVGALTPRRTP